MRSLAVIPVATCVLRTELLQLRQERDEPFRAFTAKVRGKAETCSFSTACICGRSVDYTDHVIRDVILNGLYDTDIRKEVLGIAEILEKPITEFIALVETKEMARNALPSPTLSAVSSFQRLKKSPPAHASVPPPADRAKEATCPGCHVTYNIFTEGARGWNEKPHQVCIECYRANRRKRRPQRQPHQRPPQTPGVHATESGPISQIAAVQTKDARPPPPPPPPFVATSGPRPRTSPSPNHQPYDWLTTSSLRGSGDGLPFATTLRPQLPFRSSDQACLAAARITPPQTSMPTFRR